MSQIVKIVGREIMDSRGNPTVEVEVITEDGYIGRAAVPVYRLAPVRGNVAGNKPVNDDYSWRLSVRTKPGKSC